MHLHGDFGAASMPGTWYIFFSEVVVPMARAAGVLTVPVAVYVDDVAVIAPTAAQADAQMAAFMSWASNLCGINFKKSKFRHATTHGLFLGLWWNSATLARTLEESRLVAYLTMLDEFAKASSLSLHQRQVIAGRMHRAVLTLPPGAACLLASVFALMAGLLLPWARKRTTASERADYALLAKLLRMNLGKGFYRLDAFQSGRALALSDASKSDDFCGGGYVTSGVRNCYSSFQYGGRAKRSSIMVLEGDAALKCGEDMGYLWRGLLVDFGVDNSSFKGSIAKGYTKSPQLAMICRHWFFLQVRHSFLVRWFWLSSEANLLADHLSLLTRCSSMAIMDGLRPFVSAAERATAANACG